MTSNELEYYIRVRNYELNRDELSKCTNVFENPQLNHIIYENDRYKMWDCDGKYFEFGVRVW